MPHLLQAYIHVFAQVCIHCTSGSSRLPLNVHSASADAGKLDAACYQKLQQPE